MQSMRCKLYFFAVLSLFFCVLEQQNMQIALLFRSCSVFALNVHGDSFVEVLSCATQLLASRAPAPAPSPAPALAPAPCADSAVPSVSEDFGWEAAALPIGKHKFGIMVWHHLWFGTILGVRCGLCMNAFHISIALIRRQSCVESCVRNLCLFAQEDRKRRFFMLDEIRIAEGEGKVVGIHQDESERLEDAGMQSLKSHGISWNIMEYHGMSWNHVSFLAHCGTWESSGSCFEILKDRKAATDKLGYMSATQGMERCTRDNQRNDASGQMVRGQIVWRRLWTTKKKTRRTFVSLIIWKHCFLEILIQFSTYIIWYHMKYLLVQFVLYKLSYISIHTHMHVSVRIQTCIIILTVEKTWLPSVADFLLVLGSLEAWMNDVRFSGKGGPQGPAGQDLNLPWIMSLPHHWLWLLWRVPGQVLELFAERVVETQIHLEDCLQSLEALNFWGWRFFVSVHVMYVCVHNKT